MSKGFTSRFSESTKKAGRVWLAVVAALTLGAGMLSGCGSTESSSVKEPDTQKEDSDNGSVEDTSSTQQETNDEPTRILTVNVEGEIEEIPATLYKTEEYAIYIPDEGWKFYDPDMWMSDAYDMVQFGILRFEGQTEQSVRDSFTAEGYEVAGQDLEKQLEGITYKIRLFESDAGTWGVRYNYPSVAEEGWGARLPVIVETFHVTGSSQQKTAATDLSEDALKIRDLVDAFTNAYFSGDKEAVKSYLAGTFSGKVEVYEGSDEACDFQIKYLENIEESDVGESAFVSVQHRANEQSDSFDYLAIELIKQAEGWKIASYGLEK